MAKSPTSLPAAGRFEHDFQKALYGAGIFMVLLGTAFGLANGGGLTEGEGALDFLAHGFNAFFFALFSGVMIGVGSTLAIDGLILGMRGNKMHILLSATFSVLSLLLGAVAIAKAEASTFPMVVLFFAGMASSGAFMLSGVVFGLSTLFHSYLNQRK